MPLYARRARYAGNPGPVIDAVPPYALIRQLGPSERSLPLQIVIDDRVIAILENQAAREIEREAGLAPAQTYSIRIQVSLSLFSLSCQAWSRLAAFEIYRG
jgi:hypothetical protein